MIRIFSDGWIYKYQKWGGINTYFDRLMHYSRATCDWTLVFDRPPTRSPFKKSQPEVRRLFRSGISQRLDFHVNRLRWSWWDRSQAELYHPTYYAWLACHEPDRLTKPLVITLHDCIHERFPEHQKNDPFTVPAKRQMIEQADRIICISSNTANDVDHFYPGHASKIRIVLSGTDFHCPDSEELTEDAGSYFAFVGTRHDYKNFQAVIEAVGFLHSRGCAVKVKVSGLPPNATELESIRKRGLTSCFEWLGWLPEDKLSRFYRESTALIYPSLYEGFGLPVLDAMACGTTVIAHDGSSLSEVVGDGGILVDTQNPEAMAAAMQSLVETSSLRKQWVNRSVKRARELNWRKTAQQTEEVYRELLQRP